MSGWSVIVWAVVTPDLRDAIEDDLREAALALEGVRAEDIHVHVVRSGPGYPTPEVFEWKPPLAFPKDLTGDESLGLTLKSALCWQDASRRRLLVLWGHGNRAFPIIGGYPDVPTAHELVEAFTDADNGLPRKPELIGYDACRMASVETVLTLAGPFSNSVLIGSMVPEPASGWPYVALLRTLLGGGTTKAVAAAIVEAYAASVDVPDWCLAAVDLGLVGTGTDRLAGAVHELMMKDTPPSAVDFFDAAAGADTYDDSDLVDLGALMRRLSLKTSSTYTDKVRTTLRAATFARRASGSLAGRDGLSVRVGMPPVAPGSWPADPAWTDYFPDL